MKWLGKILGVVIGLVLLRHPIGAVLGALGVRSSGVRSRRPHGRRRPEGRSGSFQALAGLLLDLLQDGGRAQHNQTKGGGPEPPPSAALSAVVR